VVRIDGNKLVREASGLMHGTTHEQQYKETESMRPVA